MPPKCPYCNVELEYEERMDSEYYGDFYADKWTGYCPRCMRIFNWTEIYTCSKYEELEEVKELE